MQRTKGERIFEVVNTFFMSFLIFITVYPLLYVVFASFSDPKELLKHTGLIYKPLGKPTLDGYVMVFRNPNILIGYRNTIFYVVVGTFINLVMTTLAAYILSRKEFFIKKFMMIMIVITMFFGGGLIPFFLVVKNIGLYNKFYTLIIIGAINSFNMIIMRTFMNTIPDSLEEAAMIEGANDFDVLTRIILPLSKPVIAVMILYYGVGHWNSWFQAYIFLRNRELVPLQLVLREILIESQNQSNFENVGEMVEETYLKELIRYCTIIVATLPILLIYPFLQKYFVKGVMIGALKG